MADPTDIARHARKILNNLLEAIRSGSYNGLQLRNIESVFNRLVITPGDLSLYYSEPTMISYHVGRNYVLFKKSDPKIRLVAHADIAVRPYGGSSYYTKTRKKTLDVLTMPGAADDLASLALARATFDYAERDLGLAITFDEESEGLGARYLAKHLRDSKVIVMEPTEAKAKNCGYGYAEIILEIPLTEALHPDVSEASLVNVSRVLQALASYLPEASIMNIEGLKPERAIDEYTSIADLRLKLNVPLKPGSGLAWVIETLENLPRKFEILDYEPPRESHGELSQVFYAKGCFKAACDANVLARYVKELIVFGPGSLRNAHTIYDSISYDEVYEAAKELVKGLEKLGIARRISR